MKLIQPALLIISMLALLAYLRFFRSVLVDRLLALFIFALQVLAITFPEATNRFAQSFGVGRGADLLFYLFASGSVFVYVLLYGKLLSTEAKVTQIARTLAIRDARKGN
ncbi:MAG: DUF2304 domain-containing protein [Oligoflexia bacterium]|nr:DUF2304 domain-containing protein [Oligoflexia bacterium]